MKNLLPVQNVEVLIGTFQEEVKMAFRFLSYYGILALTHLFVQIALSHREYLNQMEEVEDKNYSPKVAVIIPSYNEEPENLVKCVNSCLNQKYKGELKIYFIDDGSKNKSGVEAVKRIKDKRLIIIDNKINKGKREAQKCAFDIIPEDVELFVTVDSDALLNETAIYHLVQPMKDEKVGAVTGNTRGKDINFLSKLIDARYWSAFNQERGSQSLFGVVLCCCGVSSVYRGSIIRKIKNEYVNDYFLGIKNSFGDDRFATFLLIREGYEVKYAIKSKAITSVPLTLKSWLKQQYRWNLSYYKYLTYNARMMFKSPKLLHPYAWYDLTMQTILPFMLLISLGLMILNTIFSGIMFFFGYIAVLVGVALIRGTYAFFRTKELKFFLFPAYAFLHIFLLIPIRFYALATLKYSKWGTREVQSDENRQYSKI